MTMLFQSMYIEPSSNSEHSSRHQLDTFSYHLHQINRPVFMKRGHRHQARPSVDQNTIAQSWKRTLTLVDCARIRLSFISRMYFTVWRYILRFLGLLADAILSRFTFDFKIESIVNRPMIEKHLEIISTHDSK